MWCLALGLGLSVRTGPASDAIASLPSYGALKAPQWSGFLNASKAVPGTYLHYWFAATDNQPTDDDQPIVLCLNELLMASLHGLLPLLHQSR